MAWALDFGTTNTLLARWDERADRPVLLDLPEVCRRPGRDDPLEAPRAVPSAVHLLDHPGFWARLGERGPLSRAFFLGKLAHIGRPAVEMNRIRQRPNYAPTFKRALSRSPLATLARAGGRTYSAREVARTFLRELLAEVKAAAGVRLRDVVITTPVQAFETYRAELVAIAKSLGIRHVRFIDEPVAAALGYGLSLTRERRVLVLDFGGGTLHAVVVRLRAHEAQKGHSEVLAKTGRDIGGNLVDLWFLEELCRRLDYRLDVEADEEQRLYYGLMLAEACRVKEAVYFQERVTFELPAPEDARRIEARMRGAPTTLEVGRDDLVAVLEARGLYRTLQECVDEVLRDSGGEIDDVLMVGGSSLLPNVYPYFEQRFGRDRVRAWQPFEAVAYGGAVFAQGRIAPADFIVHDYALLTHDLKTQKPEHAVIVPRGTRFPTQPDLWKRQLVPTCALGEPEKVFKLVVCEVAAADDERKFGWDGAGQLRKLGGATAAAQGPWVVKLNEANPALGYLDPPHSPRDTRPRLEVSFGVNGDRWLCATVYDLKTRKHLMKEEPVVRLL